jgi:hypothetical protein
MEPVGILLLDDGELSDVARLLDELGLEYTRLRGGEPGRRLPPPRDLLVTTPRRAQVVRRGSPRGTPAGRPVRIIAVEEDSTAMRRMLRRMGFHLLVRLPCESSIWRLLIRRALYQGDERRSDPRVTMAAPVSLTHEEPTADRGPEDGMLVDISNRGCRLVAEAPFSLDASVSIDLPESATGDTGLTLCGTVARIGEEREGARARHTASVIFDDDMDEAVRVRLGNVINRWSMGPPSMTDAHDGLGPPLPACESRAIPGLTLDDETDPSIRVGERVALHWAESGRVTPLANDRRQHVRGAFAGTVVATSGDTRKVLMGRDLSAGGMRIERLPGIALDDRFRLALYGPSPLEPFEVSARVIRDDGEEGLALAFEAVDPAVAEALEKLVACLPDVESLEEEESHAMGAVLSELLDER